MLTDLERKPLVYAAKISATHAVIANVVDRVITKVLDDPQSASADEQLVLHLLTEISSIKDRLLDLENPGA